MIIGGVDRENLAIFFPGLRQPAGLLICQGGADELVDRHELFASPGCFKMSAKRLPIVGFPAAGHAGVVVIGDVDMDQIDPATLAVLDECQDERGIQICLLPVTSSPTLDDEFSG